MVKKGLVKPISRVLLKPLSKSLLKPPPGFKRPKVKDFISDMQRLGEEIAEEFKETIVENIETNRYGYDLDRTTIERKGSDVPLVDTHQLVDAIYRDGTTVSVKDSARDDSPLSNLELAIVQEYGTKDKHIPARPVWRETFKDFKDTAHERVSSFLDNPKFKK
jgi:hypothetical protein